MSSANTTLTSLVASPVLKHPHSVTLETLHNPFATETSKFLLVLQPEVLYKMATGYRALVESYLTSWHIRNSAGRVRDGWSLWQRSSMGSG